jgi:hypothetical protein
LLGCVLGALEPAGLDEGAWLPPPDMSHDANASKRLAVAPMTATRTAP